jgi:histidinol-phosphatase (PHP family)
MFDCHVHTKHSTDSRMDILDAVKSAEKSNVGIIITEHMDINYPVEGKFIFDPDKYFREYTKYKSDKLLLGIEVGMQDNCLEENKKLVGQYPFDYVIGSIHLVNGMDIYTDEYYEGKSKKEAYEEYFNTMLQCIRSYDFVDSLAHIDYIARYAKYEDREIYYKEYSDCIDEILRAVINNDLALEINTRRFDNNDAVHNIMHIYKRYSELGGKMVVIGSDSHNPDSIALHFEKARQIAELNNLDIVYFKNRVPEIIK